MTTMTNESTPASSTPSASGLRTPWMVVGGLAIAAAGVAAGLAWRPAPSTPTEPVRQSMVSNESVVEPGRTTDQVAAETKDAKPADVRPADAKPVPAKPKAQAHKTQ